MMPVYNEARTLRTIVDRVLDAPVDLELELVCVDDASTDGSWRILQELAESDPRIRVFRHDVNRGKGAAIRTAIQNMTGDYAIVQDADLEYDPRDYPKVLGPLLEGKADAVYGSRFAVSEERRVLFFWHSLGNKVLTTLSNMANDLNLTDMETCYKAVRADVLKRLRLTSDRFGIEPEITARLAQWGARIYEVPISYHGRSYAEGKHIGWRDGVQALWLIFKFRFFDTRFTFNPGLVTRQSLGRARGFRRWVLDQYRAYLRGRVVELSPGPGHTTQLLLGSESLVLVEEQPELAETLRRRFGHLENVRILTGSVADPQVRKAIGEADTVLCFEDLQRVEDPKGYLEAAAELLSPGGHLLIHVPADPSLSGPTDATIGHRRRFTGGQLADLIEAAGLEVVENRPFNVLGRIGWRIHSALGRDRIGFGEAAAFSLLVPLAKVIEGLGGRGLSRVAVARKA